MRRNRGPKRKEKDRCKKEHGRPQAKCPLHELRTRCEGNRPSGHTSRLERKAKTFSEGRFCAWKKGVDRQLFEVGLTTAVLREVGWRQAYEQGICCRTAAETALNRYRQERLPNQEMVQTRRGRLLTLVNRERREDLKDTVRECSESLLRDALRLAGPSQQALLERILEDEVG